jgi:hypothetical protein
MTQFKWNILLERLEPVRENDPKIVVEYVVRLVGEVTHVLPPRQFRS